MSLVINTLLICSCSPQTRHTDRRGVWLGLERLTCVPIQTRMVKESMLTKEEKAWIKVSTKAYNHKRSHYWLNQIRTGYSEFLCPYVQH